METIPILLGAAALVALFLALLGNTRPLGGLAAAFVSIGGSCLLLLGMRYGVPGLDIILFCGVPLVAFFGYILCASLAGWDTMRFDRGPRIFFLVASLACLGGALTVSLVHEKMDTQRREDTAAQALRKPFPPTYRDLCAPVVSPERPVYDPWPARLVLRDQQAASFFKDLTGLLRQEPLAPDDERNRTVLAVLRLAVDEIKQHEKRRELLADAEWFWNAPDPSGQYRLAAAVIIGCPLFRAPLKEQDELAERVLPLKEGVARMRLWEAAERKADDELISLVCWGRDETERERLFNDVLHNEPKAHSWRVAEKIIPLYRDQKMRETVLSSLTDTGDSMKPEYRGLYYGQYMQTGNERWLELGMQHLFTDWPKRDKHELFFLSEQSILRGDIDNGIKQRAEYLLTHLDDYNGMRSQHWLLQCSMPCSVSTKRCLWGKRRVSYKIGDDFSESYLATGSTNMSELLRDFEDSALRCFALSRKTGPVTPEERQCVFTVIEKMNIREEPANIRP